MSQKHTILEHLMGHGSITHAEAETVYGIRRLSARIHELREDGVIIHSDDKADAKGQRYIRYRMAVTDRRFLRRLQKGRSFAAYDRLNMLMSRHYKIQSHASRRVG